MDDNKSNNSEYGSYFQEASDELDSVYNSYDPSNNNGTPRYIPIQQSTYIASSNGQSSGNSTSKTNTGRVRPNGYNRTHNPNIGSSRPTNIPRRNNYRRPSNLTPPRNNSNNESKNGNEESESRVSQTRRRAEDTTEKVVKIKKTITFLSKYKFIIIGVAIAIILVILFMFLIMVIDLEGDDDGDSTSTTSYDEVTMNTNGNNNGEFWYPIGSSEVTTSIDVNGNNIEFRSGTPVPTTITSVYGQRYGSFHHGVDIAAGGDIYLIAMADGVISAISSNRDTGYNNKPNSSLQCSSHDGLVYIYIKHNNGVESRYLHVREKSIPSYLKVGSKVYQGQVVGMMGNTGCSTGQHLHYELRINNESKVPSYYGVLFNDPRPFADGVTKRSEDILKEFYEKQIESTTGEVTIGGDNKQTVCLTFKDYGYPDTGVAALMVNIQHESNFNPKAVNELNCVGLVQWCFGRQVNVKSKYGSNWVLINNQLEHIQNELTSSYKGVYNYLKGNGTTSEKTYNFCMKYEVPGQSYCIKRRDSSKNAEYYNYVKNGCK